MPHRVPPEATPSSPTLPAVPDAEVAIVGGSLAGIAAALFLAERGVRTSLLEARPGLGLGASGRHLGHLSTGLIEQPHRLVHALGLERARALYRFSQANQRLWTERIPGLIRGGWWAATDAREPDQLRESAEALRRLGVPSRLVEGPAVDAALGTTGLGAALFFEEDGVLDARQGVEALAGAARQAGAHLEVGREVLGVHTGGDQLEIHYRDDAGARSLRAEIVIFAAGPWLPAVESWFDDKVTPVREQALITRPIPPLPFPAGRAGYGYTFWRQAPDGRLLAGGCRWATPHLEVGERDDTAVVDRVQQRIEGFLKKYLPAAATAGIERRWSWIVAQSCDGLPLLGPLPGDPRRIACTGFGGNAPGLALAAARGVVDGLLGPDPKAGSPVPVPDFLAASRFL